MQVHVHPLAVMTHLMARLSSAVAVSQAPFPSERSALGEPRRLGAPAQHQGRPSVGVPGQ